MDSSVLDDLIEVTLPKEDSFLLAKETLTRIGIAHKSEKKLWPSCVILHKQGKYYLVHFLQMFGLDGKVSRFNEDDRARLHTIAALMEEWGILNIVDKDKILSPRAPMNKIKVIPFKDKQNWTIVQKYQIGGKKLI